MRNMFGLTAVDIVIVGWDLERLSPKARVSAKFELRAQAKYLPQNIRNISKVRLSSLRVGGLKDPLRAFNMREHEKIVLEGGTEVAISSVV